MQREELGEELKTFLNSKKNIEQPEKKRKLNLANETISKKH